MIQEVFLMLKIDLNKLINLRFVCPVGYPTSVRLGVVTLTGTMI